MAAETAPESAYAAPAAPARRTADARHRRGGGRGRPSRGSLIDRSGPSTAAAVAPTRSIALQPVTKRDLVETASYDGTLAYDDQSTLSAAVPGTITRLPKVGVTATRGRILYAIDNVPTVLMYGSFPMYRTLQSGVTDGRDVEELEQNLTELGYGADLTVDDGVDVRHHDRRRGVAGRPRPDRGRRHPEGARSCSRPARCASQRTASRWATPPGRAPRC